MELMGSMKEIRANAGLAKDAKKHETLKRDQQEHIGLLESELSRTRKELAQVAGKHEVMQTKLRQLTQTHDGVSSELLNFREKMAEREETIRQLKHGAYKGEPSNAARTRDELEEMLNSAQANSRMLKEKNGGLGEDLRVLQNKVNNQRLIINRYEDADRPSDSRKVVELRMALRQKSRIIEALEKQLKGAGENPDYLPPRGAMSLGVEQAGKKDRNIALYGGRSELLLIG